MNVYNIRSLLKITFAFFLAVFLLLILTIVLGLNYSSWVQNKIGSYYEDGFILSQNYSKAKKWYEKRSEE
ncbi:MAG: SEL1-like repeat protein, partial [Neisseriaceae bacterium]|nr:SEL1-like repeat protein [Neisseriaceae bacterium]